MITWNITDQQVEQLALLLDIATKAGGLEVAKVTVSLMNSLMQAVSESKNDISKED